MAPKRDEKLTKRELKDPELLDNAEDEMPDKLAVKSVVEEKLIDLDDI